MAWGMFCWIPCPYKQWREEERKVMVAMLPLVGTGIGLVLCLIWWILSILHAGQFIAAAILTASYFLLTGFIHLDGYMDCSDAILPRHAEQETRIRILKDSHSGAFAMVCLSLMLIIFFGAMMEIAPAISIDNCLLLVLIFTASRFTSAVCVLNCAPMKTSQYAEASNTSKVDKTESDTAKARRKGAIIDTIPALVILLVVLGATEIVILDGSLWALVAEIYSNALAAIVILAAAITCKLDRKMLGGMSGDVSGHMITTAEMFGMAALGIIVNL